MKTLILSAGLGERLKPKTQRIPKVMVQIGGKPLLWYTLKLLKKHKIDNIWINLHAHPEVIKDYLGDGSKFGVKITYSYEKKLLGTSGALKNNESGIEKEFRKGNFLVFYGDNFTNFDLTALFAFHKKNRALITIGLFENPEPLTGGVIKTDGKGRVLEMIEKPKKTDINNYHCSAGIYVCELEILEFIPEGFSDFGFDIIPKLIKLRKKVYAMHPGSYFQDIGTPKRLAKAKKDFKMGKIKFK